MRLVAFTAASVSVLPFGAAVPIHPLWLRLADKRYLHHVGPNNTRNCVTATRYTDNPTPAMLMVLLLNDVQKAYTGDMHDAYELLRHAMVMATQINDKLLAEAAAE